MYSSVDGNRAAKVWRLPVARRVPVGLLSEALPSPCPGVVWRMGLLPLVRFVPGADTFCYSARSLVDWFCYLGDTHLENFGQRGLRRPNKTPQRLNRNCNAFRTLLVGVPFFPKQNLGAAIRLNRSLLFMIVQQYPPPEHPSTCPLDDLPKICGSSHPYGTDLWRSTPSLHSPASP